MREAEFDELFSLGGGPMPPSADFEADLLLRLEEEMTRLSAADGIATLRDIGLFFALRSGEDESAPVFTDEPEQSDDTSGATTIANDEELTRSSSREPVLIAEQSMDARDAWDAELVRALVADDVSIEGDGRVRSVDGYAAGIGIERAIGWRLHDSECETIAVGPPAEVTCTYTMENAWSIALGVGPFTGSQFELSIADGLITKVRNDFEYRAFTLQAWTPFRAWLRDNHLADHDVMYTADDGTWANTTPEALSLWEERTAEFVAATESP